MKNLSRGWLVGLGCVLCFVSGLSGALVALAIDEPDVIEIERFVSAATGEGPRVPSAEDFERLRKSYVDHTGIEDEWTGPLVDEIAAAVCDGGLTASGLLDNLGSDIVLVRPELDDFVEEVRAVCPSN